MAGRKTAEEKTTEIIVLPISHGYVKVALIGMSPLIVNNFAMKNKQMILYPRGRMSAADKLANMKHNPIEEFRASCYTQASNKAPTRLTLPAPAFKGALASAALDLPGANKTEMGRLTWIEGTHVNLWGVPKLLMSVVRMADAAKTPDVKARAILPEWACMIGIRFVQPNLNERTIANLLAAAGLIRGVGDFRQEKGKGNYGQFRICEQTDTDFKRILATGGLAAQDKALRSPEFYDAESEELVSWFEEEKVRRGRAKDEETKATKGKAKSPGVRGRKLNGDARVNV